ncbi:hypothetical protein [Algimonas arctica]|nr:hypothetical protein [Algimonas arctica]
MTNYDKNDTDGKSGLKATTIIIGAVAIAGVLVAGLYLVDLDQTQEARLPDVDVQVSEGQMPKFDVDVADVSVGSREVDVEVPTVGVETKTKTIEIEVPVDVDAGTSTETVKVPTIDIDRPAEDNPADEPNK